MAIHVSIGYREGFMDKGKPYVKVIEKSFESANDAILWWCNTGFNDGDGSVADVLNAAESEYVGTEHEIMTPDSEKGGRGNQGSGYTKLWCCIEGQEGRDTFDDRLKDMIVEEIISMGDLRYQLNGRDVQGRKVWQMVTLVQDAVKFRGM